MKVYDVLDKLITASPYDEGTRHDMHAAIAEHHSDDINALSDEEKEGRPAPVNRLVGTAPALFAGGLSEEQLDKLVDRVIAKREAAAKAAEPAETETAETVQ